MCKIQSQKAKIILMHYIWFQIQRKYKVRKTIAGKCTLYFPSTVYFHIMSRLSPCKLYTKLDRKCNVIILDVSKYYA